MLRAVTTPKCCLRQKDILFSTSFARKLIKLTKQDAFLSYVSISFTSREQKIGNTDSLGSNSVKIGATKIIFIRNEIRGPT